MNKTLFIIRHAKSDWSGNEIDFNRPLNHRGLENVPLMAKRIYKIGIIIDQIISSPAARALSTAKIMAKEWKFADEKFTLNPAIYEASVDTLLKIINGTDPSANCVALFGHNNGITNLANYLSSADITNIPTCGVVMISFPFDDWKMISQNTGELKYFDYPKNKAD
jgi:phosphohistidine phosphatase